MVEIECNGWNGLKLHCQGRTWDLAKGDTFTSETEGVEIMIDVQDTRVMIQWPQKDRLDSIANLSDSSWDDSPRSRTRASSTAPDSLQSSPIRRHARMRSPVSPTPVGRSSSSLDGLPVPDDIGEAVKIYEDESADEQKLPKPHADVTVSVVEPELADDFSSDLSDPEDVNDPDEENDPVIHAFGPFGANLSSRFAAITAESPAQSPRIGSGHSADKASAEPEEPLHPNINVEVVTNHVVNQLAFSRLSSNPLTAILNNLPLEEKRDLSKPALRRIIEGTKCIGVITRQGKDAAGKALESEYYYIPEHDMDDSRRVAVTDGLRKPSLRACRKQHKVLTYSSRLLLWFKTLTRYSNITGNGPRHHDDGVTAWLTWGEWSWWKFDIQRLTLLEGRNRGQHPFHFAWFSACMALGVIGRLFARCNPIPRFSASRVLISRPSRKFVPGRADCTARWVCRQPTAGRRSGRLYKRRTCDKDGGKSRMINRNCCYTFGKKVGARLKADEMLTCPYFCFKVVSLRVTGVARIR